MSSNTDMDENKKIAFDTSSAAGIAKLLLLFLWVLLKKLLKFILKCIVLFFYKLYKLCKWCAEWWTDGNTKAKRAELWQQTKLAGAFIWKWTCIVCVIIYKGIILFAKAILNCIIHMRTTAARAWNAIKNWYRIIRATDFKAIIQEKKTSMAQSITEFVKEDSEDGGQSEEELLRELKLSKKKNNKVENAVEKLTKYLE